MRPVLRFKEFTNDWGMCKLGDVCMGFDYGIGASATDFDGIHKYIRITDIDENSHKYIGNPIVSPDCIPERKYLVNTNDILFARTGASTGKTYLYNEKDFPLYFAGFLIRFNVNKANPSFIFYNTLTRNYNNWVKLTSARSGQPGINSEELKNYSFECPSIEEQTKIATFLNLYYKKIELQKKKIEQYKIKFINLFKFLLSNLKLFEVKPLGSLCEITTGKLDANAMVNNGKYKFFTCAKEVYNIDKFAFDTEALLISGNGANVGYIHYFKGKFNAYQRTYILDSFADNIQYIKMYLEINLPKRIKAEKNEGNTPYIVLSTLTEMNILVPAKDIQDRLSECYLLFNQKINLEQQKLELLEKYKQGLLQKLFI